MYQSRLLAVIEELEESLHLHKQDRFSLPDMPEHSPVNSQTVKAVMIDTPDEPQDGSLEDRRSQVNYGYAVVALFSHHQTDGQLEFCRIREEKLWRVSKSNGKDLMVNLWIAMH